jgi:hypothetical protein
MLSIPQAAWILFALVTAEPVWNNWHKMLLGEQR